VFRTRDLLVRQRIKLINAIRGHLTEYGWVAPKGPSHVARLADLIEEEEIVSSAHAMFRDVGFARRPQWQDRGSRQGDRATCSRGRSIAPADERFRHWSDLRHCDCRSSTAGHLEGRDFAAWLGLTPLQRSTGGKQKLGATSKMGERTLRRLLIIGSSAVVQQASKRGAPKGSWLEQMLTRKSRMLVTVALGRGSSGHYL
jgi:transposase